MSPDHAWVDTFLYTDKDTGEEYYVVKPVESSKGQIPDNSDNKGSENCYGNYQSGVGFLRLYCEFYNRVMPDSTVPAWKKVQPLLIRIRKLSRLIKIKSPTILKKVRIGLVISLAVRVSTSVMAKMRGRLL